MKIYRKVQDFFREKEFPPNFSRKKLFFQKNITFVPIIPTTHQTDEENLTKYFN
jgi:hypothetical protein